MGLRKAITPSPVSALDMTWAPRCGANRSRTMARAHITPAPSDAPCSARQAISDSMVSALALPRAAST